MYYLLSFKVFKPYICFFHVFYGHQLVYFLLSIFQQGMLLDSVILQI